MSETQSQPEQAPLAPGVPADAEKLEQVRSLLEKFLAALEVPAKLEVKDAADGGISVAVFVEGELPGFAAGKRSNIVDALQFLANKSMNRPGVPRRWISLGVGGHAPPRPAPAPRPLAAAPAPAVKAPQAPRPVAPKPAAAPVPDEATLEVEADPALAQAVEELAQKSARLGRYYAICPMGLEDRARVLQAARPVGGLTVRAEGEGRNRRVVFAPDKPTPMPKKAGMAGLPVSEDEEEL